MDAMVIEQIVAHCTPSRLPVPGEEGREHRIWIVRLAADLPERWNPEDVSAVLTEAAASAVRDAREARGLQVDDQDSHTPVARVLYLDALHVIVNVTTIKLEEDDAHEYLVAASAALRALEATNPIDDIQGIPRRFWRIVIG